MNGKEDVESKKIEKQEGTPHNLMVISKSLQLSMTSVRFRRWEYTLERKHGKPRKSEVSEAHD